MHYRSTARKCGRLINSSYSEPCLLKRTSTFFKHVSIYKKFYTKMLLKKFFKIFYVLNLFVWEGMGPSIATLDRPRETALGSLQIQFLDPRCEWYEGVGDRWRLFDVHVQLQWSHFYGTLFWFWQHFLNALMGGITAKAILGSWFVFPQSQSRNSVKSLFTACGLLRVYYSFSQTTFKYYLL